MAKSAKDYKVTEGYGCRKGYPLHQELCVKDGYGFHMGEDRIMPVGTPIVVNQTIIGKSGNFGYVTGPHLHIGRFTKGKVNNPSGRGFTFKHPKPPVVIAVNTDPKKDYYNGRWVRIQTFYGHTYVYLHMDKVNVKVGDKIK